MDSSRKQFKALSMAQPIKRQIDDTLNKLQQEKRKFLSLERQQGQLKQQLTQNRRQLNEIKLLQPKTRVKQSKNIQTSISIRNTDRIFLNTIDKISELRTKIDVHRKQIEKYKKLVKGVVGDILEKQQENDHLETSLVKQQEKMQTVKANLLEYRSLNIKNTDEFKNSFHALHRSSVKEQNERRKSQALRKSFNYEELKNSNVIRLAEIQEEHSTLEVQQSKQELYMTNCIPLVKERIRVLIHNNKEKIKISQNYKKFGQQLEHMFSIMKEYKGRDDVGFIAEEFVMKEKQLKKIEQYIGKLENRLMWYKSQHQKIKRYDQELVKQLKTSQNQQTKVSQQNYIQLQNQVKTQIEQLKVKEHQNTKWLQAISKILAPLVGEDINRGNIDKILGQIQEKYLTIDRPVQTMQEKPLNKSPTKNPNIPAIDQREIKGFQANQLMSYEKLRQYAKDYIAVKK